MSADDPQPVEIGIRLSQGMRLATTQFTAPRDEEYEISGLTTSSLDRSVFFYASRYYTSFPFSTFSCYYFIKKILFYYIFLQSICYSFFVY